MNNSIPIYICKSTILFSDYQDMAPIKQARNVKLRNHPWQSDGMVWHRHRQVGEKHTSVSCHGQGRSLHPRKRPRSLPASVWRFIKVIVSRDKPYHSKSLKTRKNGSSVQCADAFRIALTEEPEWVIQQKHSQDPPGCLFYHHPTQKPFHFNTQERQTRFRKVIT